MRFASKNEETIAKKARIAEPIALNDGRLGWWLLKAGKEERLSGLSVETIITKDRNE